jgi:hypothetical protein
MSLREAERRPSSVAEPEPGPGPALALVLALALGACSSETKGATPPFADAGPPASSTPAPDASSSDASNEPPSPAACPTASDGKVVGTVEAPDVIEASGLAASAKTKGVLWTHNDSGASARLFALGPNASLAATIDVEGADAVDWEAIASAPWEGAPALYIGDIGDNEQKRPNVTIYVVPEPSLEPAPAKVAVSRRIDLHYEDGAHNAEALLVDPLTGTIVIVSKAASGESGVYVADLEQNVLVRKHTLSFSKAPLGGLLVTDGAVSADGKLVALRTYTTAYLFRRETGVSIADALAGTPCPLALEIEPQGEAITFAPDGTGYFTLSEKAKQPLFFYELARTP